MTLSFGSLFTGIGGLDLGLERAGMVCCWQVECDPYANRVLEKHWPRVARYEDVRGIGVRNLEPVDLICGGFPCQDISNAGNRAGIDGKRSGLWGEFNRIICELRPRYVLVENVSALLGRGLDRVLGDLAASGYDAEWDCIPAAAVGAHHRRDRVFIVGYADGVEHKFVRGGTQGVAGCLLGPQEWNQEADQSNRPGQNVANTAEFLGHEPTDDKETGSSQSREPGGSGGHAIASGGSSVATWHNPAGLREFASTISTKQWAIEPNVGRVADGVPRRVDRLRGLGNAVVPQVAEFIGQRIMEVEKRTR